MPSLSQFGSLCLFLSVRTQACIWALRAPAAAAARSPDTLPCQHLPGRFSLALVCWTQTSPVGSLSLFEWAPSQMGLPEAGDASCSALAAFRPEDVGSAQQSSVHKKKFSSMQFLPKYSQTAVLAKCTCWPWRCLSFSDFSDYLPSFLWGYHGLQDLGVQAHVFHLDFAKAFPFSFFPPAKFFYLNFSLTISFPILMPFSLFWLQLSGGCIPKTRLPLTANLR